MSEHLFTPFDDDNIHGGERDDRDCVSLSLSYDDIAKIRRGSPWRATVTDLRTGRKFVVKDADCGAGSCRCAARVIREIK